MTINSSGNYWISPTALTITLNANGDKDYIQANVAGGAMIMCYMAGIDGLGFDNGHNYQRWQLVANPTYFNSETEKFVYVAIPRSRKADNDVALVVYPSEKIDVYGKNAANEQLGSDEYYYVFLHGVISASVVNGEDRERVWTERIETGTLSSDEALTAGGDSTWWQLNIVDQTVSFLKEIVTATIRELHVKFAHVTKLVFGTGTITGVADKNTAHDSQADIVTPAFLFGNTDARFVRRDIDDKLNNLLTFLKGVHFGEDFQQSLSGAGIYKDDNGLWHIEGDIFHARRKLTAEEVELMKSTHINGKVINSPGSFTISKVEKIDGGWRCYFTQQDGDGRMVSNTMEMDDYAYCETFNLVNQQGKLSNHYWHRRVFGLGTDYVDICGNTNADDYASGSDEPKVGDEVSTLGNKTNPARQHAIIQAAAGTGSPYYRMYVGINSFSMPKPKIQMSPTEGSWWMVTDDHGNDMPMEEYIASLKSQLNAVQQQADKQFLILFGDAIPTLTNEPANEWTDNATREMHLHDIYYNRSYAQTGGGRSYSFEKQADGTYYWKEITDADVLKSLEAAKQAQDTADGKRRVFVKAQPTPPYDKGDQWANASYDTEYQNDLLVCVKPKKKGEAFDIADWQSAQAYTTKKFEAQLKVRDKTIDAAIRDLRTGLESVGMHLDGENSTFDIVADRFKVVTTTGKVAFFTSEGKLNTDLLDAKQVVTKGIQTGDIDAKNAKIRNLIVDGESIFKGKLKGASGSFTELTCINGKGEVVGSISFSSDGRMTFEGDTFSQGTKNVNGILRSMRFYASDIWCRGQFGHFSKVCAEVKDDMMFVHHGGHENSAGVKVKLTSVTASGGQTVYVIPLYSPGNDGVDEWEGSPVDYDNPKINELYSSPHDIRLAQERELPIGAPIDVVVINSTAQYYYAFRGQGVGKSWVVINGNDQQAIRIIDQGGWRTLVGGFTSHYIYVPPKWLNPEAGSDNLGGGVLHMGGADIDWR